MRRDHTPASSAEAAPRVAHKARHDDMLRDLKKAGLKMTPQRIAIVRLFAGDESHPTAQALFERLRSDFPTMSFATVYNTLDALANAGLSTTLRLGNAARFDPNTTPHHHAVCDRCGAVRDVPAAPSPSDASARKLHRTAPGFAVRTVERIYRGLCATCAGLSGQQGSADEDGTHEERVHEDGAQADAAQQPHEPSAPHAQERRAAARRT